MTSCVNCKLVVNERLVNTFSIFCSHDCLEIWSALSLGPEHLPNKKEPLHPSVLLGA